MDQKSQSFLFQIRVVVQIFDEMLSYKSQILMMNLAPLFLLVLLCSAQDASYDEATSGKMIQLSTSIYDISDADFEANRCPTCYEGFNVRNQLIGSQILSIVGVDDALKAIIVVFRGSENAENWLTNIQIWKVTCNECKGCKVHEGFYDAYKSLLTENLEGYIKAALDANPTYRVITTGHSLGGAIASLAAAGIAARFPEAKVTVYTCGQPRVGNQDFADFINNNVEGSFRVVYKYDPVPHNPGTIVGFKHAGHEIWYDSSMLDNFKQCEGSSKDCSNSVSMFNYSVDHHFTEFYNQLHGKGTRSIGIKFPRTQPTAEFMEDELYAAKVLKAYKPQRTSDLFDKRRSIPVSSTEL